MICYSLAILVISIAIYAPSSNSVCMIIQAECITFYIDYPEYPVILVTIETMSAYVLTIGVAIYTEFESIIKVQHYVAIWPYHNAPCIMKCITLFCQSKNALFDWFVQRSLLQHCNIGTRLLRIFDQQLVHSIKSTCIKLTA